MKRLLLILLCPFLLACIWDSDTLHEEAQGNGDTLKVIVGWFDRNPDLYYQMRLNRVSDKLKTNPENLALYDDAAVACDRLHRPLDGIQWMNQKAKQLQLTPNKEHQYRYLANLGTFHTHHWISLTPEQRTQNLPTLEKGLHHITQAIILNPDAHFGREIIQAAIIHWLIKAHQKNALPPTNPELGHGFSQIDFTKEINEIAKQNSPHLNNLPKETTNEEIIEGLAGIIRLGAAWNSPDIFAMLGEHLSKANHNVLALTANDRFDELKSRNSTSLHPNTPYSSIQIYGGIQDKKVIEDTHTFFKKARTLSEKRHTDRTNYMLTHLNKGLHPDTHPDFWTDWQEPTFPSTPNKKSSILSHIDWRGALISTIIVTILATLIFITLKAKHLSTK